MADKEGLRVTINHEDLIAFLCSVGKHAKIAFSGSAEMASSTVCERVHNPAQFLDELNLLKFWEFYQTRLKVDGASDDIDVHVAHIKIFFRSGRVAQVCFVQSQNS